MSSTPKSPVTAVFIMLFLLKTRNFLSAFSIENAQLVRRMSIDGADFFVFPFGRQFCGQSKP
jgi:hypothetical protein